MNINPSAKKYIEKIREKCQEIKPLVVIRSITFNHENYLRDTLESFVIQKTDFPFVAIVHDDASTDDTAEVLREYAEKYPDIILPIFEIENQHSKKDGSLDVILMEAVKASGAKYVALCEGDDYWTDPLKLQKQVDLMKANDNVSLIHSSFETINEKGEIIADKQCEEYKKKSKSGDMFLNILSGNYILTCTVLTKAEVFFSPFYINSPVKLDLLTFLTAASMGKILYINENFAHYRRSPNGQMISNFKEVNKKSHIINNYTLKQYLSNKLPILTPWTKKKLNIILVTQKFYNPPFQRKEILKSLFKYKPTLIFYIPFGFLNIIRQKIKGCKITSGISKIFKHV